jgi:hypothetical protein
MVKHLFSQMQAGGRAGFVESGGNGAALKE